MTDYAAEEAKLETTGVDYLQRETRVEMISSLTAEATRGAGPLLDLRQTNPIRARNKEIRPA